MSAECPRSPGFGRLFPMFPKSCAAGKKRLSIKDWGQEVQGPQRRKEMEAEGFEPPTNSV